MNACESALIPIREKFEVFGISYAVDGLLGRGAFGCVSHIKRITPSGKIQELAAKEQKTKKGVRELDRLLPFQQHPHIIRLYGFGPVEGNFVIVMERARHGDLHKYVGCFPKGLPKPVARAFYDQVLNAVHYLHQGRVAHCDIKPKNILVMGAGHVRLTDFGQAALMDGEDLCRNTGTPSYKPPENFRKKKINGVRQDLWGAAASYVYMIIGQNPWILPSYGDPSYLHFRRGSIFQYSVNSGWMRFMAWEEFDHLQRLLHDDPDRRLIPTGYNRKITSSFL